MSVPEVAGPLPGCFTLSCSWQRIGAVDAVSVYLISRLLPHLFDGPSKWKTSLCVVSRSLFVCILLSLSVSLSSYQQYHFPLALVLICLSLSLDPFSHFSFCVVFCVCLEKN